MVKKSRHRRPAAPSPQTSEPHRLDGFIAAALAVLTIAIYADVVRHQFINLDDTLYISENPMVNRGLSWAGIGWAFTTFQAANWHPLTWLSHMIDSQVFGVYAGGHIFVNVLIHAANTVLLFLFLLRTTGQRWSSALVAALFALHPLHVESVAWAAERKDTLSTFFGLLSLIAYCRYAETRSKSQYAWSVTALALGLMSKPMLVTWPFVMLLVDFWPLQRKSGYRDLIIEKISFFAMATASAVITVVAQTHGGAVRNFVDAPVWLRLSNAIVAYAKYFILTFWPHDLAVYYPFSLAGIPLWQIIGAIALLLAITILCLLDAKKRPYLLFGWLWFCGTLVPVIGILQVGGQTMADRYHYIPSIGLFAALVFAMSDFIRRRGVGVQVTGIAAAVVLTALAILTFRQIRLWRDSTTLFRHTLAVTPPNMIIELDYGLVLGQSGQYAEAVAHFAKALQVKSDSFDALINMGIALSQQRRLSEAVPYFQRAANIQPGSAKPHFELGLAYANLKQDSAAVEELQQAVRIEPDNSDARANLGLVLLRLRKVPEATSQLQEAIRLNPDNAEAHNNLGMTLLVTGRARESLFEFETALRLKPELQVAADNIRRAQAQLNSPR